MLIEDLVSQYHAISNKAVSAVPAGSLTARIADEILEMVRCYASDSRVFFRKGDLVNAFAAAVYGCGWIDAGCFLGYTTGPHCGMPDLAKEFPSELFEKLEEKTLRYRRMLTEALQRVAVAADAETVSAEAAAEIAQIAARYLAMGEKMISADYVNALSAFSYGYGWLDCAVRAGLFTITGNRHLFTI